MSVWADCPSIEAMPGKCGGRWTFAETRIPVYLMFGALASGYRLDDFCVMYGMNIEEKAKAKQLLEHLYKTLEEECLPGPYLEYESETDAPIKQIPV